LDFPEDKNCRNNLHQYFLGRDLMIGIYDKQIYFPEGAWKDYWTGQVINGSGIFDVLWPENRGGALYIRSGAIIPFGPEMQYWGEKPMDTICLYVFPDTVKTEFNFYEDDGISMEHLNGKYSITPISIIKKGNKSIIQLGTKSGSFEGMVENREWKLISHAQKEPKAIWINGKLMLEEKSIWNKKRNEVTIKGIVSPATIEIIH
jgi:alpha-glucosidase (family GH31 glycosyl hydrolase)